MKPDDHVLEIGTGWGSFAIYAARHYGCRVTTTTISPAQYKLAVQRIEKAGLSDRITVLCQDYRELSGQYDKLVSIEMIEAIGYSHFDAYFDTCSRLLKNDGMMLLQSITITDQRYETAKRSVDFIQR
ncbi:Cyclopropane-fatty-acyl-phospholipid synthase, partial [Candidatus Thiomargarita nelsonii]